MPLKKTTPIIPALNPTDSAELTRHSMAIMNLLRYKPKPPNTWTQSRKFWLSGIHSHCEPSERHTKPRGARRFLLGGLWPPWTSRNRSPQGLSSSLNSLIALCLYRKGGYNCLQKHLTANHLLMSNANRCISLNQVRVHEPGVSFALFKLRPVKKIKLRAIIA